MPRPKRAELEAENLVLHQELEAMRDRLDELLDDSEESDAEPLEEDEDSNE